MKKLATKIIALSLSLLMLLLAGCGSDKTDDASATLSANSKNPTSSASAVSSNKSEAPQSKEPVVPEVNDYSERTYKMPEIIDYLKINGRYAVTKTGVDAGMKPCITFDHSAMMVAFNADCEGDVTLQMTQKVGGEQAAKKHYYLVVVDGVESRVAVESFAGAEARCTLPVATGLARGKHTFEIYRQTELNFGIASLVSVTMKGVPTERPADKKLYIEFLGDSITAGYGDLTVSSDTVYPQYPEKSSGTDTYAFVAAKQLDADMYGIARSGLAFVNGLAGISIADYWNKISWARPGLGDYEATRQADVVVINLGTNDDRENKNWKYSDEELTDYAVRVLNAVREDRPDAKIIWYYGMMGNGMKTPIKQAIEKVGGNDKGFYYLGGTSGWDGGGGHPSKAQHQAAGKVLADYITSIL